MDLEDQGFLLDAMEEGRFTIDKYAIHHEVKSPTTIIATANPTGTKWNDPSKISNGEIPVLSTLLDRVDQVYAVNDFISEEECRAYARKKAEMQQSNVQYNYDFLKSYIKYAKKVNPIISVEAQYMLTDFWLDLKKKDLATNRTLDSLFRIAKAQARLHLSDIVDEEIVTEVMNDYQLRMSQYGEIAKIIESPRDAAYKEMFSIIRSIKSPIELTEAARTASRNNEQVKNYLGPKLHLENNRGLRTVYKMLLNHHSIKLVKNKPIVLLYSEERSQLFENSNQQSNAARATGASDISDISDAYKANDATVAVSSEIPGIAADINDDSEFEKLVSHASGVSDRSDSLFISSLPTESSGRIDYNKVISLKDSSAAVVLTNDDLEDVETSSDSSGNRSSSCISSGSSIVTGNGSNNNKSSDRD